MGNLSNQGMEERCFHCGCPLSPEDTIWDTLDQDGQGHGWFPTCNGCAGKHPETWLGSHPATPVQ